MCKITSLIFKNVCKTLFSKKRSSIKLETMLHHIATVSVSSSSVLSRDYNCDSTTIRRYHDAFDYDGIKVIEITICVRFDCDTTTIRLRRIARACFHSTRFDSTRAKKMNMSIFRRSLVVVVSQSNRNCGIGFSECCTCAQTQESRRSSCARGSHWRSARSLPRLCQQRVTQHSRRDGIFCHLRTISTSFKTVRTSQRWHWYVLLTTLLALYVDAVRRRVLR